MFCLATRYRVVLLYPLQLHPGHRDLHHHRAGHHLLRGRCCTQRLCLAEGNHLAGDLDNFEADPDRCEADPSRFKQFRIILKRIRIILHRIRIILWHHPNHFEADPDHLRRIRFVLIQILIPFFI